MHRLVAFAGVGALVLSCSATSEDAASNQEDIDSLRHKHKDGGAADSGTTDAGTTDAGAADGDDGPPTRVPCTSSFGSALTGAYGRLDGFAVAVVPPASGGACSADRHHVHLQVSAGGATYDIAINTDSGFIAQKDMPLPGAPWSEGWHKDASLDYPTDLGLHDADFTAGSEAVLDQDIETALATANHVSVFATPFNHGGAHLVHRQGSGHDGALVTDPLSAQAHVFAFHFSNQTF
jgi:hypothetical protein